MGKLLYTIALAFHLSVALLHHIGSAAMVCGAIESVLPTFHRIKAFAPIRHYAHYTGTGIGSGYFAPRVGSFFHVAARVIDKDGHSQQTVNYPWATRAAQLRYTAFCQLFQGFVNRDNPEHAYEQAVAHNIAKRMARPLLSSQAKAVVVTVSVYRPPTLAQYSEGTSSAVLLAVFRDTSAIDSPCPLP